MEPNTIIYIIIALVIGLLIGLFIKSQPCKNCLSMSPEDYKKAKDILERESAENQMLAKQASEIMKGFEN